MHVSTHAEAVHSPKNSLTTIGFTVVQSSCLVTHSALRDKRCLWTHLYLFRSSPESAYVILENAWFPGSSGPRFQNFEIQLIILIS